MSDATPPRLPNNIAFPLRLACSFWLLALAPASSVLAAEWQDLRSSALHANHPSPDHPAEGSSHHFFASVIAAIQEIEYLASHKRYQELLNTAAGLTNTLERAKDVLPDSDQQRAARFIAASRSLGLLSKAVHSFMWNGKTEQLFEATDKIGQLTQYLRGLLTPEELRRALASRESPSHPRPESAALPPALRR